MIRFFFIRCFFCESLRLQNRFQTANLLFGAPRFPVDIYCFSSKYSAHLVRISISIMFVSFFLVAIPDVGCAARASSFAAASRSGTFQTKRRTTSECGTPRRSQVTCQPWVLPWCRRCCTTPRARLQNGASDSSPGILFLGLPIARPLCRKRTEHVALPLLERRRGRAAGLDLLAHRVFGRLVVAHGGLGRRARLLPGVAGAGGRRGGAERVTSRHKAEVVGKQDDDGATSSRLERCPRRSLSNDAPCQSPSCVKQRDDAFGATFSQCHFTEFPWPGNNL